MSADVPARLPDWITNHIKLYQTDPEKAHYWDSSLGGGKGLIPTLLLSHKGRKSGDIHHAPLIYSKQGDNFAVIASKGGAQADPVWYLNLLANPEVEIQVGAQRYKAKARTAPPAERAKIWADMVKIFPPYDDYQAKAGRVIPVVVLEPV